MSTGAADWLLQDFERFRQTDEPFHVDPLRGDAEVGDYVVFHSSWFRPFCVVSVPTLRSLHVKMKNVKFLPLLFHINIVREIFLWLHSCCRYII